MGSWSKCAIRSSCKTSEIFSGVSILPFCSAQASTLGSAEIRQTAMFETVYTYEHPSSLQVEPNRATLTIASDTNLPSRPSKPAFLKARVATPLVTARALRAISEIVGERFYVPPSMLARILREADPVATVGMETVRFEGFSACCSADIRLDIDDEALEIEQRSRGTTNVDFGPELHGLLPTIARDTHMEISIGQDAVEIIADGDAIIEKRVPLPLRWIKGFGEVQVAIAKMQLAFSLPRIAAQRFLRGLPRGANDQKNWVAAVGPAAKLSARESKDAVPLRGCHRLRVLEPLVGLCEQLDVYVNKLTGATCRSLNFGSQRLSLVVNAEPWRGFSVVGGLLIKLTKENPSGSAAAKALSEKGAVQMSGDTAKVLSENVTHSIVFDETGWRCTCPWFSKNGQLRGPCKHVLAVELALEHQK